MSLLGHETAWSEWRSAMASTRMHHGWLLAGGKGLGKAHFAMAAARDLVALDSHSQPPTGDHPDIIVLKRLPKDDKEEKKRDEGKPFETKRNISVAQIRAMQQRLTTRPSFGSRRVIIIDPADDVEASAANALLKSLEEPPTGTYFILIAHRPARLLPTIRSRCRTVRFPSLSHAEVEEFLAREAPEADVETRQAAVVASGGSPGAALQFVDRKLGAPYRLMKAILEDGDPHFIQRGKLGEVIGARPDRDRLIAVLDLARAVLAGSMAGAPHSALTALSDAHAELVALTGQAPTYNFDPGLLVAEIGSLLASAGPLRERANV